MGQTCKDQRYEKQLCPELCVNLVESMAVHVWRHLPGAGSVGFECAEDTDVGECPLDLSACPHHWQQEAR
jgi:hypothetical protein